MKNDGKIKEAIELLENALGEWADVEPVYQPDEGSRQIKESLDLLRESEGEVNEDADWINIELDGPEEYKNIIAGKIQRTITDEELLPEDAHDFNMHVSSSLDLAELVDYGL